MCITLKVSKDKLTSKYHLQMIHVGNVHQQASQSYFVSVFLTVMSCFESIS